ncbi:hypothetical protein BO85DRAFT_294815 [Aspergillus piperis CBS 112811]|uniref:Uncharacterized protein n=1 Tax=Aspergillus piperis CBS 112811 TaxID=1448313 RepID=A0A8G1VPU4_9EURO|nr:hypothetical protein BO85DRAFT_294815 [Aspergillus piperis CBS 112811]RAH58073.1 hypothetical protein BO85DRAFT_294815 [Aspergillus piperis CBS 112811]
MCIRVFPTTYYTHACARWATGQPELVLMIGEAFPRVLSPGEWMWKWKLKVASTSSHRQNDTIG